jgi:hypothetical protein
MVMEQRMRSLREIAIDTALDIGAEMAQEITGMADDILESSGDAADVAYLRQVVDRWESAWKIIHQEPPDYPPLIERLADVVDDLLDLLDPDDSNPDFSEHNRALLDARAWLMGQAGQMPLPLEDAA